MILDRIVEAKREELVARKRAVPQRELQRRCRDLGASRDFEAALRPIPPNPVRLVAEVKKASPSRGVLAAGMDPVALACRYAEAGAAALSVLTDAPFFHGELEDLAAVRRAVTLPILRKDFILEEYQLWESRAWGADAILLIVAILEPGALRDLRQAAKGLGLAALVEVHTREELERALDSGATIVGVNNRDLRSFTTLLDPSLDLLPLIPPGIVRVSESGLFTRADVLNVVQAGAHAVLVGEALVRSQNIQAKVRELALLD